MTSQEIEQFETHMDKMDRLAMEHKHELALAQEKTKQVKIAARESRHEAILWAISIIAVVAVILGIVFAIYKGTAGPSSEQQLEDKQISRCYDEGGEWEPDRGDEQDPDDFVAAHCDMSKDGLEGE